MTRDKRIAALATYFDLNPDDVTPTYSYDNRSFEVPGGEWLVLTDKEADTMTREAILDSVWAFRPEFLAAHAIEGVDIDVIRTIQANDRCEANSPVLLRLIKDVDHFVEDAIKADGRGHFLSPYDFEEVELKTADGFLFAYRVN